MPLSEEELRLLEQMERALSQEDPKFASTLRGRSLQESARRRALLAGVVLVGGIALLMTGAVIGRTEVGVLGFLIMLAATTVAMSALRARQPGAQQAVERPSIRDRFEHRLKRRQDDED